MRTGTFNTSDATTFTTGSKDTLPISGWQCTASANVNSKIDVMNAYAAAYTATNGDQILYFALERNANTGDANVAFWFLQDQNVGCTDNGGTATFTGAHTDGDLLVVSAFTNGGVVSNIDAYRWDGGANGVAEPDPGRLGPRRRLQDHGGRRQRLRDRQHRNDQDPVADGEQARRRRALAALY